MNRLITAYVADTSACPKRQAVFYCIFTGNGEPHYEKDF